MIPTFHILDGSTFVPQACEMMLNPCSTPNRFQLQMLSNTDPGAFVFILIAAATIFGLFLYGYVICQSPQQQLCTENLQLKLRPDTRIGCSNGLCYLHMFKRSYRDRIVIQIGYFPSILALTAIPKIYRTKAKGSLELIGDGVAHFEPNVRDGGYVWDILEETMSHFDHIGCRGLRKISHNPPEGYSYLVLFVPTRRNVLSAILGPNPLLQVVIDIDPTDRLEIEGFVFEKEEGLLKLIEGDVQMDAWARVIVWNDRRPGARIGG